MQSFTPRQIFSACLLLALSACASIPSELTTTGPFSPTTPQQAQSGEHDDEQVRWGGVIINTKPMRDRTCFEMMGLPLESNAEPVRDEHSLGRFIACAKGFYEPTLYEPGRRVTFTGRINGTEKQKIGEYVYTFPRLDIDALHLWPKTFNVVYVPVYDPLWDPFWDPYWPYYYRPYHYRR
jgi:outer membrane lipoprotein